MLLNGVNIQNTDTQESQPCLTLAQTILFNAIVESTKKRHSKLREPPLPLYIGFTVHAMTRNKSPIAKLYRLGISVSYQCIVELEDMIANSVSEPLVDDGVVAPACLKKGVFTVGALDNLDHNPSSTTAASSFHGTGINRFQLAMTTNPGEERPLVTLPPNGTGHHLPDEYRYAVVPPVELDTSKAVVPECCMKDPESCITEQKKKEDRLQSSMMNPSCLEIPSPGRHIMLQILCSSTPPALTALLPLFYKKADTPAVVKHGMDVLKKAITFLNPHQVPVITFDQPLFALSKMVQWKWPASHGEHAYVVMMGGLHIEMVLWDVLGDLSGWTAALAEAGVASSGVADSFLMVTHFTRTRYDVTNL